MANAVTTAAEPSKPARSSGEAVIRAEEVHKYYELGTNRVHALRGVGLEIFPGEFVAVMGASEIGRAHV